jgi:maltose alpha-D-glucosyltransferase/alpha-amylase
MALSNDPMWFKDAIFYEVYVRGFYDSAAKGVGDFRGLTERLDYIDWLGINCIWLLPTFTSPMRDGGYDISNYRSLQSEYGTMRDFERFLTKAHSRGIRVIADLVLNHTSDQHPWFQEARSSPTSPKRDWYVWSDTNHKYEDARIIFFDSETSNWHWDDQAGAYYWHRFFWHQPDLNFDNPEVRKEIIDIVSFWFNIGIDGFRLDAVPYLYERQGTNCENLPETHAFLKELRAYVDEHYPGKLLLAEANQWPEDVVNYFGNGDECHMSYHFPIMPRIFVALQRESRRPMVEILERTPEIPENCQWGMFLRNHDELTAEMVTDEERDYLYAEYAKDPRMRLNQGIRRRLAPLLNNGRRRIELLHAILFSLPGSPFLYYGDEIGMGDNIYLGDRNGVRTPMQWSADRNAGFSRADFAQLYLPVIMDSVYGYEAVNVEAQRKNPTSLLHWVRQLIALRRRHPALSRGSLEIIRSKNRRIFAFTRTYKDEILLCAFNLARSSQPAELDLRRYQGLTPFDMQYQVRFPTIGEKGYPLSFNEYGFYWFLLRPTGQSSR